MFKGFFKKHVRKEHESQLPSGLWLKCDKCKSLLFRGELENNLMVCPKCGYHFPIPARDRLYALFDEGVFDELDKDIASRDILNFIDIKPYTKRLEEAKAKTGLSEAAINARGKLGGIDVVVTCLDFRFMGGSMGAAVGEKIVKNIKRAANENLPFISISASGGARMQEGTISLMQMARTSAALTLLEEKRLPFISVLTHPTMGGVSASFAFLGDVIIAEPGALIGFAGPRVIKQTIRQKLPKGFQTSEFLLEHGLIDMVVERHKLKETISRILNLLK